MTWALYELSQHPEWEAALLDEVHSVMAAEGASSATDSTILVDALSKMRVTRAVYMETLRQVPGRTHTSGNNMAAFHLKATLACTHDCAHVHHSPTSKLQKTNRQR